MWSNANPFLKVLMLSLWLTGTLLNLSAQSDELNLEKYWKYRGRFLGNGTEENPGFISVGMGPGKSMPMSGHHPERSCRDDWWMQNSGCTLSDGKGKLKWGDGTIHMGYYLATLATHYALISREGGDTRSINYELDMALEAVIRLDTVAETVFGLPPRRNGFFVRDDVPQSFYLAQDGKTLRFPGHECVHSNFSCGEMQITGGDFVSQDQVIHLLFGLAFAVELVPDEAKDFRGNSLKEKAIEIVHTMVNYLSEENWRIRDPLGNPAPNRWGGDVVGFSWMLSKAGAELTGRSENAYQSGKSRLFGSRVWDLLILSFGQQRDDNQAMALELAAITAQWPMARMSRRAEDASMEVFALAQSVFHGQSPVAPVTREGIQVILNSAPDTGPCFNTPGCEAGPGWKGGNRWIKPLYSEQGNPYNVYYNWNGLDYMLLYNLYHLVYLKDIPYEN
ncbi:MAG: hypothetical protein AAGI38_20765 [Bacteroidota bacterium]